MGRVISVEWLPLGPAQSNTYKCSRAWPSLLDCISVGKPSHVRHDMESWGHQQGCQCGRTVRSADYSPDIQLQDVSARTRWQSSLTDSSKCHHGVDHTEEPTASTRPGGWGLHAAPWHGSNADPGLWTLLFDDEITVWDATDTAVFTGFLTCCEEKHQAENNLQFPVLSLEPVILSPSSGCTTNQCFSTSSQA